MCLEEGDHACMWMCVLSRVSTQSESVCVGTLEDEVYLVACTLRCEMEKLLVYSLFCYLND